MVSLLVINGNASLGGNLDGAFEVPKTLFKFAFYPAFCVKNAELEFNFGASPWKFEPKHFGGNFKGIHNAESDDVAQAGLATSKRFLTILTLFSYFSRRPLAIILEPTRELAQQTHEATVSFMKYLPAPKVELQLVVGGVPITSQVEALEAGADIVTGTPGRISDIFFKNFPRIFFNNCTITR
jgi:ATP-dependent RNA helicase DDX1